MISQPQTGKPPEPGPPDYPGARRSSFSSDRRPGTREGRSRTADGPKQGPVRRIQSSGPGSSDGPSVVERHQNLEKGMLTCGGFRQGAGRSMTSSRRGEGDSMLVKEVEELRARTAQMEKTLR